MKEHDTLYAYLIVSVSCLLSLAFYEGGSYFVLAFFLSLALSFSTEFLQDARRALLPLLLFGVVCFFLRDLICFAPLSCFVAIRKHAPLPLLLPVIAAFTTGLPLPLCLYLLIVSLLSGSLSWMMEQRAAAEARLVALHDERTTEEIRSQKERQALKEKQDAELVSTRLAERNRIAREIHDSVGHLLSRAILLNGAIRTINHDEALTAPLAQLEDTLTEAMSGIRSSVHDLHDDALDLEEEAQALAEEYVFCPVSLQYRMGPSLPREVRFAFLQVMKEALANVARHSDATQVEIAMIEHPALYRMTVADNGTGAALPGETSGGIGLQNMTERVRALNGTIHFTAENGFHIFLTIPKEQKEDAAAV